MVSEPDRLLEREMLNWTESDSEEEGYNHDSPDSPDSPDEGYNGYDTDACIASDQSNNPNNPNNPGEAKDRDGVLSNSSMGSNNPNFNNFNNFNFSRHTSAAKRLKRRGKLASKRQEMYLNSIREREESAQREQTRRGGVALLKDMERLDYPCFVERCLWVLSESMRVFPPNRSSH